MIEKLSSGAKALINRFLYGTAEPVPFVQSIFPQPVETSAHLVKMSWSWS
jgi:hypothetical protein